jgi:hypothetical protein
MKKILLFLFAAFFMFTACNNNKKPGDTTITSDDGKEKVTFNANDMKDAAEEMTRKKDELSKLTPLTLDQLKALVPETLMGAKRTNYEATSAMGTGSVEADYELNDSTNIRLNIIDCAGSAGAGIYSLQFLGLMNIEQESDEEYTKSVDFNGGKAYEHCNKSSNDCTFTFFSGGRFLVTLDGDNVGAAALKQAAGTLNIK